MTNIASVRGGQGLAEGRPHRRAVGVGQPGEPPVGLASASPMFATSYPSLTAFDTWYPADWSGAGSHSVHMEVVLAFLWHWISIRQICGSLSYMPGRLI